MDRQIKVDELFRLFWEKKISMMIFTFIFSILSISYSLYLPNKYLSLVTLTMSEKSGNNSPLDNLPSSYGSLASLAGISLGSSDSQLILAQKIISSRDFVKRLISFENVLPNLVAASGYDFENDQILYDKSLYDPNTKKWVFKPSKGKKNPPSYLEAHKVFSEEILKIYYDEDDSDYLTVGIEHLSPNFSSSFLKLIISELNLLTREKDLKDAQKSLSFLDEQLSNTKNIETRNSIRLLIEQQLKVKMLASVRQDYLVNIIDEPFIPEIKTSPSRLIITIVGTFIGFFISALYVFLRKYWNFSIYTEGEIQK